MKYLTLILIGISISFSTLAQSSTEKEFEIKFSSESIDLGSVKKGEKVSETFSFTNIGTEIVQIDLVSSCECTTLDWSRGKIMPNEEGFIQFTFDSSSKTESETIDIEIFFMNTDEEGEPVFKLVEYTYQLDL